MQSDYIPLSIGESKCSKDMNAVRLYPTVHQRVEVMWTFFYTAVVAKWLERSSMSLSVSGFKYDLRMRFSTRLSVHLAGNGYLTLFRVGEGEGGEEEEWRPNSVTPLPVRIGSLTAISPAAINGYLGYLICSMHVPRSSTTEKATKVEIESFYSLITPST